MRITFRCPPELEGILLRPIPAKKGMPDWLKAMPVQVFDADLGMEVMTVKRCPPFIDAMGHGFLMPLPCDIHIAKGKFAWDWVLPPTLTGRHTRSPMSFHINTQVPDSPFFEDDAVLVKFNSFWTMELEAGWSLLCTHPVNRWDLPFASLTGLVDADRYADNFVNFVAQWLDPGFEGMLEKGTPVAQCIPVRREEMSYSFDTLQGEDAERFRSVRDQLNTSSGVYRKEHRAKK